MPIYEYLCQECGKTNSIFFRSFNTVSTPVCPSCNSASMDRKISRVTHLKGRQRLEGLDTNRMLSGAGGPDKGRQARWARRMAGELGEDLGAEYREMAEKVEAGEEAFELYDPSAHLDYKVRSAMGEESGSDDPWSDYLPS
jgi:putative FmdB family regulatory protein